MTGVEILATQEVATAFAFNWSYFWLAFAIVCGGGSVVGLVLTLVNEDSVGIIAGVIVGIIGGIIAGTGVAANALPVEYETQYKVTISDEVSMNDFLAKYEIVDQEGKIYVVREVE